MVGDLEEASNWRGQTGGKGGTGANVTSKNDAGVGVDVSHIGGRGGR